MAFLDLAPPSQQLRFDSIVWSLQLEAKNRELTDSLDPRHRYVPWVTINGQPLYEVSIVGTTVLQDKKVQKTLRIGACCAKTHPANLQQITRQTISRIMYVEAAPVRKHRCRVWLNALTICRIWTACSDESARHTRGPRSQMFAGPLGSKLYFPIIHRLSA